MFEFNLVSATNTAPFRASVAVMGKRETIHLMATTGSPLVPPFDIPPFTISGVLPPFLGPSPVQIARMSPYQTTLVRVAERMCGSPERIAIFQGLLNYRQRLSIIGIVEGFQWLSGSFMEDIENLESRPPRDIDVVTLCRRPSQCVNDFAEWEAFFNANIALFDPKLVKLQFRCDAYFVDLSGDAFDIVSLSRYWFGLFSHRRRGLWKGMLQVPLGLSPDDVSATSLISGLTP